MTPSLTPEQRLHSSIQDNDAGSVRTLLQEGVDVNWKNPLNHNNTPLHVACEFDKGSLVIIRMLLQHPKINVNEVNIHGSAPIHRACYFGKDAIVTELLLRPVSNNCRVNLRIHNNATALWKASSAGHVQCVKKLIAFSQEQLDVQSKCAWDSDHARSAEEAAVVNKHKEVIKVLGEYTKEREDYRDTLLEEFADDGTNILDLPREFL